VRGIGNNPKCKRTEHRKEKPMSIFDFGEEKKKRRPIGKKEWEARKKQIGNKCLVCGATEKSVGGLEKAHLKAHSRGGTEYVPLCPTCHKKYDKGLFTVTELRKVGLTKEDYARFRPKKPKKKDSGFFF
jgi:hypothetical protein